MVFLRYGEVSSESYVVEGGSCRWGSWQDQIAGELILSLGNGEGLHGVSSTPHIMSRIANGFNVLIWQHSRLYPWI